MSLPLLAILTSASMSFQFHSNGWFPSVFFPVHWTSATNVISNSKSLQIGPKIILSICNEEISLRKLNIFSRVYICDWHGSIVLAASSEDKPYFVPISLLDRMKAAFIWKKAAFVVLNGEMKLSKRVTFSRNESTELMVSPSRHQTARMHVLLVDNHPDANRQTTCVIFRLVLIFTNYDAMLYMSFRRHIVSKINSFLISAKEKAL